MPVADMPSCRGKPTVQNSKTRTICVWAQLRRSLLPPPGRSQLTFGTWSVNEADKTLIRKYEIALIPNNDNLESKASVSLSGDELKLVSTSAAGVRSDTVYRRAK